jgi:hypothetical protein
MKKPFVNYASPKNESTVFGKFILLKPLNRMVLNKVVHWGLNKISGITAEREMIFNSNRTQIIICCLF